LQGRIAGRRAGARASAGRGAEDEDGADEGETKPCERGVTTHGVRSLRSRAQSLLEFGAVQDPPATVEEGSIEAWARDYVLADTWQAKLSPPRVPERFARAAVALRLGAPGRGAGFALSSSGHKSTGSSALRSPTARAKLLHTFLHHELQAAELMAWAICAFPEAPTALRRGLLAILHDELRHMRLYAATLEARGHAPGAFPVRDWFWQRIPSVVDLRGFLATLGLGFEGANLDHAARFAERFREAGDDEAAALQERIAREEIPHVRFALRWFRELSPGPLEGEALFEAFRLALPAPLSPLVMRGRPLAREARGDAGLDVAYLDALERWEPVATT
jgi:uncharacterized ferritin-like protein (DUF455 family)